MNQILQMGELSKHCLLDDDLKNTNHNNAQIATWEIRDPEYMKSSDLLEDSSSTLPHSNGSLYDLSDLMLQLPIKRGISKYYHGKSESYASLASVRNIQDLAKVSCSKRMKSYKSYANAGGLASHKFYSVKATITKKTPRGSNFTTKLSILDQNKC